MPSKDATASVGPGPAEVSGRESVIVPGETTSAFEEADWLLQLESLASCENSPVQSGDMTADIWRELSPDVGFEVMPSFDGSWERLVWNVSCEDVLVSRPLSPRLNSKVLENSWCCWKDGVAGCVTSSANGCNSSIQKVATSLAACCLHLSASEISVSILCDKK